MTSNASCSSFGLRAAAALLARTGMKANRRPTRQSCKAASSKSCVRREQMWCHPLHTLLQVAQKYEVARPC